MNEVEVFNPTRLKILDLIRNGEKCICEIIPYTGKSQPNISQHLKILRMTGLINERKDGTKIMISVSNQRIYEIIEMIENL